ncbi:transcription factor bHLH110-like [Carica papaya]|uniref:transcription factor bHLH110-like n=1 Tax=Carica papaya TaxID=3649 RepID=UPI000B8CA88B|nr:transcription factor bHLH110-like [Carica papaya]
MESAANIHFQFQLQEQLARNNDSNNMNYHRETISSSSSGSEPWAPSHHHQQSLLANHMKEEISDYNSFLKLLMTEINAEDSLSQNLISLDRNFSSTHHHQQLPELSGADHHHQKSGSGRTKTPSIFTASGSMESQEKAKKYKTMPRSSCPPLKVRKEKLGDRIAALHKLVAPFGKTDTASVLTEAIGYIQFLHDQIQTLSVPYRKSSYKSGTRSFILASSSKEEDEKEGEKAELRSRGLCLVPLSCVSFLNLYNCSGL